MKKNIKGIHFLRFIAIVSVVIYHISPNWLSGGFLGVDLFFVLGGYLLIQSLQRKQKVRRNFNLAEYISSRYLRLVIPLFVMLASVLIYLVIFNTPLLELSHKDGLMSLIFASNWWFIFKNVDYFDSFTLSPFKHLWYLGVLFQMQVIIAALFRYLSGKKFNKKYDYFHVVMTALFFASFLSLIGRFRIDNISRVYYGTDTRAFEVILGVFLGLIMPLDRLRRIRNARFRMFSNIGSLIGLVLFVYLMVTVSDYSLWLYRGGFLLVAILSALLIVSFSSLGNILGSFGENKLIQKLSDISYELYLWHFPVLVLTATTKEIGQPNIFFTSLRMILAILLAYLTHQLISKPVSRRGLITSIICSVKQIFSLDRAKKYLTLSVLALSFVFLLMGAGGIGLGFGAKAKIAQNQQEEYVTNQIGQEKSDLEQVGEQKDRLINEIKLGESESQASGADAPITNKDKSENAADQVADKEIDQDQSQDAIIDQGQNEDDKKEDDKTVNQEREESEELEEELDQSQADNKPIKYDKIVLIGDSIAINLGPAIQESFPNVIVDAKISRQLYQSAEVSRKYADHDGPNTALVIMLGTNGFFEFRHIDELIAPFPQSDVYFVNTKMPNSWEKQVNETLAAYVTEHPEYHLIDWYSLAIAYPDYLEPDKTHLNPAGTEAMKNLIFENLKR